ncbi:MAG: PorT family protein, partial [Chitinophagaceae bacterium]|nr:PorT family protein [Chitinophagaceae bacterium]
LNISPVPLISIQAGPQIGMTINQTKDALRVGGDALKNKDFSMLAGVQLKLSKLSVFGRYSFGLSEINVATVQDDSWKSKMLQAGIGISL